MWNLYEDGHSTRVSSRGDRFVLITLMLAVLLLVSGCGLLPAMAYSWDALGTGFDFEDESSSDLTVIELDFYHQPNNKLCGPAALASVLSYYDKDRDWVAYAQDMIEEKQDQWTLAELHAFAVSQGFRSGLVEPTPDQLRDWIRKGWPPMIVMPLPIAGKHMFVVVGFNEKKDFWVLLDPYYGFRKMSCKTLQKRWNQVNRSTLIVLPKQRTTP